MGTRSRCWRRRRTRRALPSYVVSAGRAVPVPYNGAVGHVLFGPIANARVKRWLEEGHFDVVHLHEPGTPSLSLLALGATADLHVPVVATFHMSNTALAGGVRGGRAAPARGWSGSPPGSRSRSTPGRPRCTTSAASRW